MSERAHTGRKKDNEFMIERVFFYVAYNALILQEKRVNFSVAITVAVAKMILKEFILHLIFSQKPQNLM